MDKDDSGWSNLKNPNPEIISRQAEEWESRFRDNNSRGKEMINFVSCGEQWEAGVIGRRKANGKESLTLNVCRKELKKLLSQNSEIEFSLDVHPTSRESQDNVEESHIFSLLLNNIVLTKKIREDITETFNKSASFGYAFGQVTYGRISNDDLCLYPIYICHKDPTVAFWDVNALSPTKIDGKYCGIRKLLSKKELRRKIPNMPEKKCKVVNENNEVIEYYFRHECDSEFRLLLSGKYKRVDLLTCEDEDNFMTKERLSELKKKGFIDKDSELTKKGKTDKIYYKMTCNSVDVFPPCPFPTLDLPLVYHSSFSVWTPERETFTIPFGYELKGAQKLLNFINSQIATQAKNSSSTKWIMKPEHVKTPEHLQAAKEINQREGAFVLGGDTASIIEKPPAQLSMSLIEMSRELKQIMDEINGGINDNKDARQTVISGEALEKITRSMRLLNDDSLASHINFFNDVSRLIGQMMPEIITEERTIVVKKMDGSSDALIVNEYTGTGKLRNNIKDLRNKFDYVIKAGATAQKQMENTIKALIPAYEINPQLFNDTADIYFRNSDCKDAGELSRRASAKIDPSLIAYSQGEMTKQDFDMAQQKQQQSAQKAKAQAVELDPTYRATVAATAAEHRKADAMQKDSDTKRIKELSTSINDSQKNEIALAKVLLDANAGNVKNTIASVEMHMKANDQMIDRMREVIGDDDMPLQGQTEPGAPNAEGGENPDQQSSAPYALPETPPEIPNAS